MKPQSVVLKFGSSVLVDTDCLPAVVHEIYRHYRRGDQVLVVVSAIGRHTESLLDEARRWMDPPAPSNAVAELLGTGEQRSAALLTMALDRAGVEATLLNPAAIKLTLGGDRLDAVPIAVDVEAIDEAWRRTPVVVVPGFAGVHEAGGTALMGRGGSDLTAVFLARALEVSACRLIKDVDGIYERDPAIRIPQAPAETPHRYGEVTYAEALRVSGALVQPKAIEYLRDHEMTARVAGLLQEDGTLIGAAANRLRGHAPSEPLKVLLMGLGVVGQGIYRHLQALRSSFEIVAVHVRDPEKPRDFPVPRALLSANIEDCLARPHDIIVDVSSDPEAAAMVVERTLAAGRPAVTASKRLVAAKGIELSKLAARQRTRFCYSAAVGGAAAMIEMLERAIQTGAITRLRGVLNGTCNFVLDQLAAGRTFDAAVLQARWRGFAESDVTRDLNGDDSADKLRILARLAFGAGVDGVAIARQHLSPAEWLEFKPGPDRRVRQVATFDLSVGATVNLEALPLDDYLAGACGEENRLVISGTGGREWRVSGKGAGRWPTAEAIVADLIELNGQRVAGESTALPITAEPPASHQAVSA